MEKMKKILIAALLSICLTANTNSAIAQDASNIETASSRDESDWGLLGLLGLIGLVGLKKKEPVKT